MGREVMEGLRYLTSLPLAGTGQREGGGFSSINKRIISHHVSVYLNKPADLKCCPRFHSAEAVAGEVR